MNAAELRSRYQANQRDFQGIDLQEENLAWTDLSGIDFGEANLQGVNFSAAILKNAVLKQANLTFANMSRVDLTGANVCGAVLEGVNLSDACLEGIVHDTKTQWPKGFNTSRLQKIDSSVNAEKAKYVYSSTQDAGPTSSASTEEESIITTGLQKNLEASQSEQQTSQQPEPVIENLGNAYLEAPSVLNEKHPLAAWQLVRSINAHRAPINAFAISPDHQWLISGGDDRIMNVWHLPTGKYHCSYSAHGNAVTSVAISSNQNWIASGCRDKKMTIWAFKTQQLLCTFFKDNTPTSHDAAVEAILFRPDSQELLSAGADQMIRIWSVKNGTCLSTLKGHQDAVKTLAVSEEGRWLVSGGADQIVRVWDLSSRKLLRSLPGHQDCVQSVAIAPQGQPILSGSADGVVKVWNWVSETERYSLNAHWPGRISVAVHPEGNFFASAGDHSVKLWDLATGTLLGELEGCAPIVFSPDGTTLVTGGAQYTAKIWQRMA